MARGRGKRAASSNGKPDLKVNYEPQKTYPSLDHPTTPLPLTPHAESLVQLHNALSNNFIHTPPTLLTPKPSRLLAKPSKPPTTLPNGSPYDPFTSLPTYTSRYAPSPPSTVPTIDLKHHPKYMVTLRTGEALEAKRRWTANVNPSLSMEEVKERVGGVTVARDGGFPKGMKGVRDWWHFTPTDLLGAYARLRGRGVAARGRGGVNGVAGSRVGKRRAMAKGRVKERVEEEDIEEGGEDGVVKERNEDREGEEEVLEEQDDDFEDGEDGEEGEAERDDYNAEQYFDNGEEDDLEGGDEGGGFEYE